MLGWFLLGLFLAGTAAVVVYKVYCMITIPVLHQAAIANGLGNAIVKNIDRCNNVVRLESLTSDKQVDVDGTGINSDVTVNKIV